MPDTLKEWLESLPTEEATELKEYIQSTRDSSLISEMLDILDSVA